MARYIDANLVKEALIGWETDPTDEEIEYTIDKIPTADVQEVKHGEWQNNTCSNCGYGVQPWNNTRFCPNCGATMDRGDINV